MFVLKIAASLAVKECDYMTFLFGYHMWPTQYNIFNVAEKTVLETAGVVILNI